MHYFPTYAFFILFLVLFKETKREDSDRYDIDLMQGCCIRYPADYIFLPEDGKRDDDDDNDERDYDYDGYNGNKFCDNDS